MAGGNRLLLTDEPIERSHGPSMGSLFFMAIGLGALILAMSSINFGRCRPGQYRTTGTVHGEYVDLCTDEVPVAR